MSGPSTMSCERCEELLTELACGELDADETASVRAHALGCAGCGPKLTAFSRVLEVAAELPFAEPAARVEQRVMQAAREELSRRAGSSEAIDSASPGLGFKAWFARLGAWAMSPQVAMASVLVLVVGIGLYALPFGRESDAPVSLRAADEPAPAGGAMPAASATAAAPEAPAEEWSPPSDYEAAPAMEAMRARPALEQNAKLAPGPASKKSALEGKRDDSNALARAKGESYASKPKVRSQAEAEFDSYGGGATGAASNAGGIGMAREAQPSQGRFAPPPPAPVGEERAARQSKDSVEVPRRVESSVPSASESSARGDIQQPAAPSPEPVRTGTQTPLTTQQAVSEWSARAREGVAAAQRGDYTRAVELLEPVVSKGPAELRPNARLWLARSLRGNDECARALSYYAPIVSLPSASQIVLDEAADCYARTGNASQASALRERSGYYARKKAAPAKDVPAAAEQAQ